MTAPRPTRVALADDHDLVRGGLRAILDAEPDLQVVGEAANGRAALDLVAAAKPDVILMDIRMPEIDGIAATRRVTESGVATRVLVVTTFERDEYVFEALRAGAAGFLLKDARPEQLVDAVRTVAAGESLLAPRVTRGVIEHFVQRPQPSEETMDRLADLTERELGVLRLVARGLSNREIAGEMFVSEATVKTHVTRVLSKLGLRSRTQAVVLAYETGLAKPGEDGLEAIEQ